jgi:hypothetical protein
MRDLQPGEDMGEYIRNLEQELKQAHGDRSQLHEAATASSIINQNQQNLVKEQLDIGPELEFISHQLRGHVIKRDKEGNEFWAEPDDPEQKIFNERGAQEIEKLIRNYLMKNLLLSNYGIKEINQRVQQFANRLRRFIFLNFEEFGMDTEYKQKHFEMIVMNITDQIESAYLRALGGEERRSLRENIQVTQSGSFGTPMNIPNIPSVGPQRQGGSKLNPINWFR